MPSALEIDGIQDRRHAAYCIIIMYAKVVPLELSSEYVHLAGSRVSVANAYDKGKQHRTLSSLPPESGASIALSLSQKQIFLYL